MRVCATALVLTALLGSCSSEGSRYSHRVEEDFFFLEMERLNCTIAETYSLHAGDTIQVELAQNAGELSISIGQENREPIYEGRNPALCSFQVTVPESGEYTFSVSGKHAEGTIFFQINPPYDSSNAEVLRIAYKTDTTG